jgi:mono/diheme cytochrome c family protein
MLFRNTLLGLGLAAFAGLGSASAGTDVPIVLPEDGEQVTYAKHISRLMQARCQECHQPNGIAPFSLMDYRQTRGWSKMIKEVVEDNRMPPWHADPSINHFANDRSLTDDQKQMVYDWIEAGMPRGNEADMPEAIEWKNEWRIGEPDMIFEMPEEVTVDPSGVVPYQYFSTQTNFEEDVWIQAAECLPGNPKVVHHIIIFVRPPNGGDGFNPRDGEIQETDGGFLDAFAPGGVPQILPAGQARKIPAGSQLIWQMHYTPTGKVEKDRSQFGIKLAKGPINYEVRTGSAADFSIVIPARDDNYRSEAEIGFPKGGTVFSFAPHMHYRGKDFLYTAVYPDGREETILSVPNYDFNWQTTYYLAEPLVMPPGSKIHAVAHFDNSENNPYNPDPDKTVTWGDQTWEEMMIGFFHYSLSVDADDLQRTEAPKTDVAGD